MIPLTAETVMEALRRVVEPCSLAMNATTNIVDMGLVEAIAIDAESRVTVTLCLTDPACVHFAGMRAFIRDVLIPLGAKEVTVKQTLEQLWTPDRQLTVLR